MPAIVIVMGVSGSGKSHLASRLAETTGWVFAEGDDYHSEANKARMAARIPLTDEERIPWLNALHELLTRWHQKQQCGILTCSALRAEYRKRLSAGIPELRYVWLDLSKELIAERLSHRKDHYMPPELLDSQLATLEPPTGSDEAAMVLPFNGSESTEAQVETILNWLRSQGLIG